MAAVSSIALGIGAAGLAAQGASAIGQYGSRKKTTQASIEAERLRRQQMELETQRATREAIRREQVARGLTNARTTNQGAGMGSSVTGGAYGQQVGQLGRDLVMLRENMAIGGGLFDANARIAKYQGQTATFEGIGRFGQALTSQAMNIGQLTGGAPPPGSNGFNSQGIGPFSTFVLPGNLEQGNPNYRYYP